MVAESSARGGRFFPEIQICFRSSGPVILAPRWQAALLSTALAGAAAFAYLGVTRLDYAHLAAKRQIAAAGAETAKRALERRMGGLQQHLATLILERDKARREVATLSGEAGNLRSELGSTETKLQSLAQVQQALAQQEAQNAALTAQLGQIKSDRAAEDAQLAQDRASLEQSARDLAQLGALRGKVTIRRGRVRLQLDEISQRLSQIRLALPAGATASPAAPAPTAAAAQQPSVGAKSGTGNLGPEAAAAIEQRLRSAGVDVARILPQLGGGDAEGGPFIPPPKAGGAAASGMSPEKLAALEALARTLPIAAPLTDYKIGSPFGPRIDPFNHRLGFHTGIDMDAPYSSPVHATAPGTVIYAGWLGDYGKVVEIDHGFGIVTLYAHLRRCLVAVGEAVPAQAEIGLVGTTGRTTGPHVHYEVRVDGQPQDPEKFLGLARLLPAAATPPLIPTAGGPAANNH